ncbi:hypothetical protein ACK3ZM_11680 [Aeromonas caviae]
MTRSRITDITPSRLAQLNRGEAEASNLTECLAVDFAALMQCTLPSLGPQALASMHAASGEGITRRMALAARLLLTESGTRDPVIPPIPCGAGPVSWWGERGAVAQRPPGPHSSPRR